MLGVVIHMQARDGGATSWGSPVDFSTLQVDREMKLPIVFARVKKSNFGLTFWI